MGRIKVRVALKTDFLKKKKLLGEDFSQPGPPPSLPESWDTQN